MSLAATHAGATSTPALPRASGRAPMKSPNILQSGGFSINHLSNHTRPEQR